MKIKVSYLALFALPAVLFFSGCANEISSVPVSVNFGTAPKGGGPCKGKGVCSTVAQPSGTADAAAAPGVAATFKVLPADKNVLVLSFSLEELKKKQPEQVAYFTDGSGTYKFDGPFELGDKMYAPLKLSPRARIDEKSSSKVEIKGDVVTVSFNYTHE